MFTKEFDELFDAILTDYRNQFPGADTSQGSLIFIKSACLASALWGIYKYQDYISKQIFPDTADTENLDHHAWIRGIERTYNETDEAFLSRLLDYIRRPPAGGNKYDYVKWALSIDNVAAAYCFPLAQGLGTVDVVIIANEENTGSEVPSSHTMSGSSTSTSEGKLINTNADFTNSANPARKGDVVKNTSLDTETIVVSVDSAHQLTLQDDIFTAASQNYEIVSLTYQVFNYIDDVRPVTASVIRVLPPTILAQNVTMTVTGASANKSQMISEIEAYMKTLIPGQTFYKSQLINIALDNGADDAAITVPADNVVPENYQMIRAGAINVS